MDALAAQGLHIYVSDSERAINEYTSEIFMGGKNAIVSHNTCVDFSHATSIIYDLCILAEIAQRMEIEKEGCESFRKFHSVLSLLSHLINAPLVPPGTPAENALAAQRQRTYVGDSERAINVYT